MLVHGLLISQVQGVTRVFLSNKDSQFTFTTMTIMISMDFLFMVTQAVKLALTLFYPQVLRQRQGPLGQTPLGRKSALIF